MHTACTVLLVDDDPTLSAVFAAVLRKGGYEVLCADGAEQALELLHTHNISAIITDLHMPKMDGAALLARITSNRLAAGGKTIPAILMTGSGEFEESHANAPGVSAILIKPIVRDTLLRTLERVLAQEKGGNLFPPS